MSWVALVGGNWNNAGLCGARYVNLNNLASNTNANIGSRTSYCEPTNIRNLIRAAWRKLNRIRKQIAEKLDENGLHMKDNWQVCRLDAEPLDFMGFRFFRDKTTLRRSIMLRITRKIKAVYKKGRAASYADACAVIS